MVMSMVGRGEVCQGSTGGASPGPLQARKYCPHAVEKDERVPGAGRPQVIGPYKCPTASRMCSRRKLSQAQA